MKFWKNFCLTGLVLVAAGGIGACVQGLEKRQNAKPVTGTVVAGDAANGEKNDNCVVDSFKSTLHPVVTQHCAACHGSTTAPTFAVTDAAIARAALVKGSYIDFAAADSSRIISKAGDGHCGANCNATNQTAVMKAVEDWVVADAKCDGAGGGGSAEDAGDESGASPTPASTPAVDKLAKFKSDMLPILTTRCNSCHGDNGPAPRFLAGSDQQKYNSVKALCNVTTPAQSELILKGSNAMPHNGGNALPNQAQKDTLTNLIPMVF